jgi:tRNA (cmo5U34)-methyltransferase
MSKDDLFSRSDAPAGFSFDDQVAEVFDDMLCRSVPFYEEVLALTGNLLAGFLRPGDTLYDLGCATGSTLISLSQRLADTDISLIGIDNSTPMLEKARTKAARYIDGHRCSFMEGNIETVTLAKAGGIILNYTLQFLPTAARPATILRLYNALRPGGVLILSEKITCSDPDLADRFTEQHTAFKKQQGYSDLEISKKREALEHVLVPLSLEENRALLENAGFGRVESFFQWCNFVSLVALKEED